MIVATINRTTKAYALAIVGAEYVLRWLPRGTHEFDKLVKPTEIETALKGSGMMVRDPQGVSFNPIMDEWRLSKDAKVNYMMVATRPNAAKEQAASCPPCPPRKTCSTIGSATPKTTPRPQTKK